MQAFCLRPIRWCRYAQPPANHCDASGILRFEDAGGMLKTQDATIFWHPKYCGILAVRIGHLLTRSTLERNRLPDRTASLFTTPDSILAYHSGQHLGSRDLCPGGTTLISRWLSVSDTTGNEIRPLPHPGGMPDGQNLTILYNLRLLRMGDRLDF